MLGHGFQASGRALDAHNKIVEERRQKKLKAQKQESAKQNNRELVKQAGLVVRKDSPQGMVPRNAQVNNLKEVTATSRKAGVKVCIVAGRVVMKVCLFTIDTLSTYMPFASLIKTIKDDITSTFARLKANDAMAKSLLNSLDGSKNVIDEMIQHLKKSTTRAFQQQVLGFLDIVVAVRERCDKWNKKTMMKKVWSSKAYSTEFQEMRDTLEEYRQNTLMLFVLQNFGRVSLKT